MSLSYNSSVDIKPYKMNEQFSQQQAPTYSPFIQDNTNASPIQPAYQPNNNIPLQQPPSNFPQQPPSNFSQQPPSNFPQQPPINTSYNPSFTTSFQPPQLPPLNTSYQQPPKYNIEAYQNNSSHHLPKSYNKSSKIKWIVIIKSILIYTILFLIISSIKMDDIIRSTIPIVGNNEITSMVFKGFIYSVLIIIIQKILN